MRVCAYCHHGNPEDSRFCGRCGARLASATERRDERKVVSVLFVDLVGFTGRAEQLDVEDLQALLDPYYALVREEAERRGGTVEKFIGDAVVAIFGVPVAHEDDAERAVRTAFAITDALAAENARRPELDLHVRMAVTTGEALVAVDVSPVTGETFASGDVVNTAARLQSAAPVDGVLVGEATYRATRNQIVYEPHPPLTAKGKSVPVPCWRAVRARARVGEMRRRQDATRLIDRREERAVLVEALDDACAASAVQSVTLVGVPGIGKSRLVRELARAIEARPELIRWREGRSPPYGSGVTFWALGEIVKAEAGLLESHEHAAAAARLHEAVEVVVADAAEAAWVERHLRTLVGLDPTPPQFGDHRAEAFAAWRRFLERLAEHGPTVLVFEDLHWADDALLDFIEHLVSWAAGVPLLVLCTTRPELLAQRPGWGGGDGARILGLGPLSRPDTRDLVAALLEHGGLPEATRDALLAGAEGNPLYAQEYVRMLRDRGALVERDGEWVLEASADVAVPDSVLGIIAARLDSVPPSDRAVIQDAAVLGRAFPARAVAALGGVGAEVAGDALARLERRHLVRRRHEPAIDGAAEYVFEHALVRDVAYRSIVRPARAEKHRRAAEWLQSLTGDPRDRADLVAHHLVTALENAEAARQPAEELRRRAAHALELAADRASSLHSHDHAAALWARALELQRVDGRGRPELLLHRGKALALAGEPAVGVLEEAAAALLAVGDAAGAAEAESTLGLLASVAGRTREAREHDTRAIELVRATDAGPRTALILTRAAANTVFVRGRRDEARGLLEEALAIARRRGLREIEAEALQFVGMARLDAGEAGGVRDLETALAVATELSSPASLPCYGNLADIRRYLGGLKEAAVLHAEGERAAERFGMPIQVRRFRAGQGCDRYYRGEWDAAVACFDAYLDAVETGSPHRLAGETHLYRGRIRLARGDASGAMEDARAALAFARRTSEPFDLLPALAFHARVSAEVTPAEAEAVVVELLDELRAGQPFWGACALPDLLPTLATDAQREDVKRIVAGAAPRTAWYDAIEAALDGDFARSATVFAGIGSRPDEAYARLRAADRALASDDADGARAHLEPAIGFLRSVGARVPLAEAEALARGTTRRGPTPAAGPSRRSAR